MADSTTDSDSTFCSDSEFHSTSTSSTSISEPEDMDFLDASCHSSTAESSDRVTSVSDGTAESSETDISASDVSTAPEVWSEDSLTSDDDETAESDINSPFIQVNYIFCLGISLLQLIYSISDRAIANILKLMLAVLQFFSSVSQNLDLNAFINTFPQTVAIFTSKAFKN